MASSVSKDGDCILVSHSSGYLGVILKNRRGEIYLVILTLKSPVLSCDSYLSVYLSHSFHLTIFIQKENFISLLQSGKKLRKQRTNKITLLMLVSSYGLLKALGWGSVLSLFKR